jgi:hypothetical protein
MDRINETKWFVDVNGQHAGPFLWDVLTQHARQGSFLPQHRVRAEGWSDWVPAAQVPGLFPPQSAVNNDAVTRALIPVGRAGSAIAAGYLGLLSPFGVFAPLAVITGALALRTLKRDPNLHGAGRAWFGIIMGTLFSAIYALALLR